MTTTIKRVQWTEARSRIATIDKRLAEALDPIARALKKDAYLYEAQLSYGELFMKKGKLSIPINDVRGIVLPGLNSSVPVCIVLSNYCEVFYGDGVVWDGTTDSTDQDPVTSRNL